MGYKPTVAVINLSHELNYRDFQYYNLLWNYQLYIFPRGPDCSELPSHFSHFDYIIFISHNNDLKEALVREAVNQRGDGGFIFDDWDAFMNDFF